MFTRGVPKIKSLLYNSPLRTFQPDAPLIYYPALCVVIRYEHCILYSTEGQGATSRIVQLGRLKLHQHSGFFLRSLHFAIFLATCLIIESALFKNRFRSIFLFLIRHDLVCWVGFYVPSLSLRLKFNFLFTKIITFFQNVLSSTWHTCQSWTILNSMAADKIERNRKSAGWFGFLMSTRSSLKVLCMRNYILCLERVLRYTIHFVSSG